MQWKARAWAGGPSPRRRGGDGAGGRVFRTSTHRLEDTWLVVIAVEPHPLGVCVFRADGNYDGGQEFRAGDFFHRHGTQSTRLSSEAALSWVRDMRDREREHARREVRQDMGALTSLSQTATRLADSGAVLSWELDLDAFAATVVEQLRRGDEVPVRRLMVGLTKVSADLAKRDRGLARTADALDRCAVLLIEFAALGRDDLFEVVLRRLVAVYEGPV